jgi:MFS family permease
MIMAPMYATMLGMFFVITLYAQTVLDYSPVRAGLAFLPFPIVLGFTATRIPKLVARYGFKRFLIIGPALVGIAMILFSRIPVHGSYVADLLPPILIMPMGIGLTFMPVFAAATSGVPPHESGLASGLITTSQQMGGALGLAVLSSIAASVTVSSVRLSRVGALVHGFDRALLAAVAFMLFAIAVTIIVIRQVRRSTDDKPQAETASA